MGSHPPEPSQPCTSCPQLTAPYSRTQCQALACGTWGLCPPLAQPHAWIPPSIVGCWPCSPSPPALPSPAPSPPPGTGGLGAARGPHLATPPAQCTVVSHHPPLGRRCSRGGGHSTGPAGRAPGQRGRAPTAAPALAAPGGSQPAAAMPAVHSAALQDGDVEWAAAPSVQPPCCPLHGPLPTLSSHTSTLFLCRSSRSWGPSALPPNCSTSCRCPAAASQSAAWMAMHTPRALQPEAAPCPGAILCQKDSASRWLCRAGMGPELGSCTVPVPCSHRHWVFPGPLSPGRGHILLLATLWLCSSPATEAAGRHRSPGRAGTDQAGFSSIAQRGGCCLGGGSSPSTFFDRIPYPFHQNPVAVLAPLLPPFPFQNPVWSHILLRASRSNLPVLPAGTLGGQGCAPCCCCRGKRVLLMETLSSVLAGTHPAAHGNCCSCTHRSAWLVQGTAWHCTLPHVPLHGVQCHSPPRHSHTGSSAFPLLMRFIHKPHLSESRKSSAAGRGARAAAGLQRVGSKARCCSGAAPGQRSRAGCRIRPEECLIPYCTPSIIFRNSARERHRQTQLRHTRSPKGLSKLQDRGCRSPSKSMRPSLFLSESFMRSSMSSSVTCSPVALRISPSSSMSMNPSAFLWESKGRMRLRSPPRTGANRHCPTHLSKMRKQLASSSSDLPLASSFIWRTIITRNSSKSMVPLPAGRDRDVGQAARSSHPPPPWKLLTILVHLLDDGIQLLFGGVLAQHPHHRAQLLGADVPTTVRIKHVEGSFELCREERSVLGLRQWDGPPVWVRMGPRSPPCSPAIISSLRKARASACWSVCKAWGEKVSSHPMHPCSVSTVPAQGQQHKGLRSSVWRSAKPQPPWRSCKAFDQLSPAARGCSLSEPRPRAATQLSCPKPHAAAHQGSMTQGPPCCLGIPGMQHYFWALLNSPYREQCSAGTCLPWIEFLLEAQAVWGRRGVA